MSLHLFPEIDQGTSEWMAARRGMVTASAIGKLIEVRPPDALTIKCSVCGAGVNEPCLSAARKEPTPIKTPHPARVAQASTMPPVYAVANNDTSRALTLTLAAERVAGFTEDTPVSSDMRRGTWAEPFARKFYSENHAPVTELGFMVRKEQWGRLGFSPDGLVGDDGLIEVKALRSKNHVTTVLGQQVPAHNMAQCQAGLYVSGREWIDFISWCGGMAFWVQRVTPDPIWFAAIEAAWRKAEADIEDVVNDYLALVDGLPVTERIDFLNDLEFTA